MFAFAVAKLVSGYHTEHACTYKDGGVARCKSLPGVARSKSLTHTHQARCSARVASNQGGTREEALAVLGFRVALLVVRPRQGALVAGANVGLAVLVSFLGADGASPAVAGPSAISKRLRCLRGAAPAAHGSLAAHALGRMCKPCRAGRGGISLWVLHAVRVAYKPQAARSAHRSTQRPSLGGTLWSPLGHRRSTWMGGSARSGGGGGNPGLEAVCRCRGTSAPLQ